MVLPPQKNRAVNLVIEVTLMKGASWDPLSFELSSFSSKDRTLREILDLNTIFDTNTILYCQHVAQRSIW